jgi:RNA polymerase sigma-70 factor (ECF subfamily)
LAEICDAYYEPVVAYLRNVFRDADVARETSHAFFAEMLGGGTINTADRERGRFRSYLLGAVKHFVSRQREMQRSLKRGAGLQAVSMDEEGVVELRDSGIISPDGAFDRQWAVTLLERSLKALRTEYFSGGKERLFDHSRPFLTGDSTYGDQGAAAAACGMSIEAFRVALHRMKKQLRHCMKEEIAETLEDAASLNDEMQILYEALGGEKRL